MFFDVYCSLCKDKGISPSAAAQAMGINKGTVSVWKNRGTYPQAAQLQKIAEYFNVSMDYLYGNEKKPVPQEDELVKDEFVAFYGDTKKDLSQADIEDIKTLMRIRAELNRGKE